MTRHLFFLHGFASSPRSHKAEWLAARLAARGRRLHVPELNPDGFERLSVVGQARVVTSQLARLPGPCTLIGSSFGGYLAARLAELEPRVEQLVLLAPAFRFRELLAGEVGAEALAAWRRSGWLRLPATVDSERRRLPYSLLAELDALDRRPLLRQIDARLFHGADDSAVPCQQSVDYLRSHPRARLLVLPDDHSLHRSLPVIWEQLEPFLELP